MAISIATNTKIRNTIVALADVIINIAAIFMTRKIAKRMQEFYYSVHSEPHMDPSVFCSVGNVLLFRVCSSYTWSEMSTTLLRDNRVCN